MVPIQCLKELPWNVVYPSSNPIAKHLYKMAKELRNILLAISQSCEGDWKYVELIVQISTELLLCNLLLKLNVRSSDDSYVYPHKCLACMELQWTSLDAKSANLLINKQVAECEEVLGSVRKYHEMHGWLPPRDSNPDRASQSR